MRGTFLEGLTLAIRVMLVYFVQLRIAKVKFLVQCQEISTYGTCAVLLTVDLESQVERVTVGNTVDQSVALSGRSVPGRNPVPRTTGEPIVASPFAMEELIPSVSNTSESVRTPFFALLAGCSSSVSPSKFQWSTSASSAVFSVAPTVKVANIPMTTINAIMIESVFFIFVLL